MLQQNWSQSQSKVENVLSRAEAAVTGHQTMSNIRTCSRYTVQRHVSQTKECVSYILCIHTAILCHGEVQVLPGAEESNLYFPLPIAGNKHGNFEFDSTNKNHVPVFPLSVTPSPLPSFP